MKTYTEISLFSNWQNEDVDNPFSYSSTQVVLWGFCKFKSVLSKYDRPNSGSNEGCRLEKH